MLKNFPLIDYLDGVFIHVQKMIQFRLNILFNYISFQALIYKYWNMSHVSSKRFNFFSKSFKLCSLLGFDTTAQFNLAPPQLATDESDTIPIYM